MKKFKFLNIITKRSFIISLFFALALWIYTSLNLTYKTNIVVPFSVVMPETRAIENDLPKNINLTIQGTGWNLINLIFFNNAKKIQVDLSKRNFTDNNYIITRTDFLRGAQSLESIGIIEINPEALPIDIGLIAENKIVINSNVEIKPHKDFILVGNVSLNPDSVLIKGNEKLLSKIKKWDTEHLLIENVKNRVRGEVQLKDTMSEVLKLNPRTVGFFADIQQLAEYEIPDIEIIIRGGTLPKDSHLYPPQVSVILQGGINEIINLNRDKIAVSIDINNILNDERGIIIPKIEAPSGFKVLKVIPEYVYHYKVQKISNLSQIKE